MRDTLNLEHIPFYPLLPYLCPMHYYPPTWKRLLERGRNSGYISLAKADEFTCTFLGLHPSEIWPEVFA